MTCKPSLKYQTLGVVVLANCRVVLSCRGHRQEYAPLGLGRFSEDSTSSRRTLLQLEQMLVQVSGPDRKSTRLNSSHVEISYAVFCLKKKKKIKKYNKIKKYKSL